jgi:hypothetical protein
MPAKLTTTVSKIAQVPNKANSAIIEEFYTYMRAKGSSEQHQQQQQMKQKDQETLVVMERMTQEMAVVVNHQQQQQHQQMKGEEEREDKLHVSTLYAQTTWLRLP